MSEAEAFHCCEVCGKDTLHLFSGSLRKGICQECGNKLPLDEKADLKKVMSYNG
jgi:uncharacterized protein (DUF983 family)